MAIKIEFGKHKGKTIKQLMKEDEYNYLHWLLQQDFVKKSYPKLYKALKRKQCHIEWSTYDDKWIGISWYDMF